VRTIATIGVYEHDAESFRLALDDAGIRLLVDVRQRRGVRGPLYTWANAQRLQRLLAGAGIAYAHHPELAPTTELRELQYREDAERGVGKRSRDRLAPEYIARYTDEILDRAPLHELLYEVSVRGPAALMCVESEPAACHRSLIAARLAQRHGFAVRHLHAE